VVDRYPGARTAGRAAQALAWLAQVGYIVSPAEHERRCDEYAALLSHVEQAADDLVRRLHETGERS
jgi:hypothetical protein